MATSSLWKNCKTCGKQIAVDAKACPQCGSRNSNKVWIKWLVGGLVTLVILGSIPKKEGDEAATVNTVNAPISQNAIDTSTLSTQPLDIPVLQSAFIEVTESYSRQFSNARNELQESIMRDDRRLSISTTLGGGLSVDNWSGTIVSLGTNTEGKGIVSIRVSPNVVLKTWNNAISDLFHNTLIEKNSSTYDALLNLVAGDRVIFSGSFFPSDEDGVYETSLTIRGAMQEPEFLFRFDEVQKQ